MTTRGGRIPPDGRPSRAKGVGKNAKRHDLENPRTQTPPLHGSSGIQQGDIQAMEQGQRMRRAQTQGPARPQAAPSGGGGQPQAAGGMQVPDAIDFIGSRYGGQVGMPGPDSGPARAALDDLLPLINELVVGPGSSGILASALINQYRQMRIGVDQYTVEMIDLNDLEDAVEYMLDVDDAIQADLNPPEEVEAGEAELTEAP